MIPRQLVSTLLALSAVAASAERLPVRAWNSADGLGHDHSRCVMRDAQGFLWFCTAAGLARFDGSRFQRFDLDAGLPGERVFAAAQTPDGTVWAGTERGLARLSATASADAAPRFRAVPEVAGEVRAMQVDVDGSLIVAGDDGVERVRSDGVGSLRTGRLADCVSALRDPRALARTDDGTIWAGGADGALIGIRPGAGGCVETHVAPPGLWVRALLGDRRGRLWAGSDAGLVRFDAPGAADLQATSPGGEAGLATARVRALFETPEATLWVGTVGGLYRGHDDRFVRYTTANGLPDDTMNGFALDRDGQLWLATDTAGVARLLADGFVSYDRDDGLGHVSVARLFEDRSGDLVAGGEVGGWVSRYDGGRFTGLVPRIPDRLRSRVAASKTWILEDHAGEWWLATVGGVLRYPRPARFEALGRTLPVEVLDRDSGLPGDWAYRLFETSDGSLWVATAAGADGATLVWIDSDRSRQRRYGPAAGLPRTGGPECFAEDGDRRLWIGWSDGSILRRDAEAFETVARVPAGAPVQQLAISEDVIWIAKGGAGAWRMEPGATGATLRPGPGELAHADVRGIVADAGDRVVFATARGLFELASGSLRHHDTASGLAALETTALLRSRTGDLWVGTFDGLSRRVRSGSEKRPEPPRLWIGAVEVDGAAVPVSPLGESVIGPLAIGPGRHRVRIAWFGPQFEPGEPLRSRYRVRGIDERWGRATEEVSLTLAGLAAGSYRFEVESAGASPSADLATVEWTIAPPLWERSWFLLALGLTVGATGFAVHRARVGRLLALERVRTRIAGDLHDDLSASLTRISVLSEVAKRRGGDAELLGEIGLDARALLDSTRDLVWAIDPRDETLAALAARLRSFLEGVVDPQRMSASLETAGDLARVRLEVQQRRHLLLLLKEAIHNAVRHSGARRLVVRIAAAESGIVASVEDDGRGFERPAPGSPNAAGRGLRNLGARADALGARLTVDAAPGRGVCVRCELRRS